jgi:hypothetical protein
MNNELEMVLKEINKITKQLDKAIDKALSKDSIKVAKLFSTLQTHIDGFEAYVEKELTK